MHTIHMGPTPFFQRRVLGFFLLLSGLGIGFATLGKVDPYAVALGKYAFALAASVAGAVLMVFSRPGKARAEQGGDYEERRTDELVTLCREGGLPPDDLNQALLVLQRRGIRLSGCRQLEQA